MLAAAFVVSIVWATGAAAAPYSKLDARIRARRILAPSGGYGVAAAGAAAAGPRLPVLIRVSPGTPISALRAAFPDGFCHEVGFPPARDGHRILGSGMFVINPPFGLEAAAAEVARVIAG